MDTTATIIVTAIINALVTGLIGGFVLYRIQKKIDNSYFEHQTRFTRSHAKTVETLETIYHKFAEYWVLYNDAFREASAGRLRDRLFTLDTPEYQKLRLHLQDFRQYVGSNRIFLPAGTNSVIGDISDEHTFRQSILSLLFREDLKSSDIEWANGLLESVQSKIVFGTVPHYHNLALLITETAVRIRDDDSKLEAIYKSAAEPQ